MPGNYPEESIQQFLHTFLTELHVQPIVALIKIYGFHGGADGVQVKTSDLLVCDKTQCL